MRISMNIQEGFEFIGKQANYHDAMSAKFLSIGNDKDHKKHYALGQQYAALNNLLDDLTMRLTPSTSQISILPSELEGLPPELIEQLSADNLEMEFLKIIEDHDGTISLDRLILAYFKQHGAVLSRRKVTAKLYRMTKGGAIHSLGGKGIYSLYDPESSQKYLFDETAPNKTDNDLLE